jgi:hypothetical protein
MRLSEEDFHHGNECFELDTRLEDIANKAERARDELALKSAECNTYMVIDTLLIGCAIALMVEGKLAQPQKLLVLGYLVALLAAMFFLVFSVLSAVTFMSDAHNSYAKSQTKLRADKDEVTQQKGELYRRVQPFLAGGASSLIGRAAGPPATLAAEAVENTSVNHPVDLAADAASGRQFRRRETICVWTRQARQREEIQAREELDWKKNLSYNHMRLCCAFGACLLLYCAVVFAAQFAAFTFGHTQSLLWFLSGMVCYAIVVNKLYAGILQILNRENEGGVGDNRENGGGTYLTSGQIDDETHRKQSGAKKLFSVIFIVVLALCIAGSSIDTDEATGGSTRRLRRALV